jgi:hypothetical protein
MQIYVKNNLNILKLLVGNCTVSICVLASILSNTNTNEKICTDLGKMFCRNVVQVVVRQIQMGHVDQHSTPAR